jgi:hypothetical protein
VIRFEKAAMNNLLRSCRVLVVVALVVAALVVVGSCSSSSSSDDAGRTAVVFHTEGDVTRTHGGQTLRVVGGEPLAAADDVTTAHDSFALLLLSNGWLTRLDAATSVRVGALVAFAKPSTSKSPTEQLAELVSASERSRLPADAVLAERVAGVEQRLHAGTTVAAETAPRVGALADEAPPAPAAPVASSESFAAPAAASVVSAAPAAAAPPPPPPAPAPVNVPVRRGREESAGNAMRLSEAAPPPAAKAAPPSADDAASSTSKKDASAPDSFEASVRLIGAATGDEPAGTPTMNALREARDRLAGCARGSSGGVVVVAFQIGVDGLVREITASPSSTSAGSVRACVVDVVRHTRLPSRDGVVGLQLEVRFTATGAR